MSVAAYRPRRGFRPMAFVTALLLALMHLSPVLAQESPSIRATPYEAAPGQRVSFDLSNVVPGRIYAIVLKPSIGLGTTLATTTAAAERHRVTATIPAFAAGSYKLLLQHNPGPVTDDASSFKVLPGLALSVLSSTPRAGKSLAIEVAGLLASGSLRVRYGTRLVYGPVAVTSATQRAKFVLPADYPSSFPANVALHAERVSGRVVLQSDSVTINVAAPYNGPFSGFTGLTSSRSSAGPRDPITLSGKLSLHDGDRVQDVKLTPWWKTADGSMTPLSATDVTIATDGTFQIKTKTPSLLSMSAMRTPSPGRIVVQTERTSEHGVKQVEVTDVGAISSAIDIDPDVDLRIVVRKRGTQQTLPLKDALVVIDSDAPLHIPNFDLPFDDNDDPDGFMASGSDLLAMHATDGSESRNAMFRTNQYTALFADTLNVNLTRKAECPPNLYRRATGVDGIAEYLFKPRATVGATLMDMGSMLVAVDDCVDLPDGTGDTHTACHSASDDFHQFKLRVYTSHTNAGYPNALIDGADMVYDIRFNPTTDTFKIRNLRTGVTVEQSVSATIIIEVPVYSTQPTVPIEAPYMFVDAGNGMTNTVQSFQIGSGLGGKQAFGRFVDFGALGTTPLFVAQPGPVPVMSFLHHPGVVGSLTGAKLYIENRNNPGNYSFIGNFQQATNLQGCSVDTQGSERWDARLTTFAAPGTGNWFRYPQNGFILPGATPKRVCGYVEASNALGNKGKQNFCWEWQDPPADASTIPNPVVDDRNPNWVTFNANQSAGTAAATATEGGGENQIRTHVLGEPLDYPGTTRNASTSRRNTKMQIGLTGVLGAARDFTGSNADVMNATGDGAAESLDIGQTEIGEDEWKNIVDESIPLFRWYWGIPEIVSAKIYADLRVLASYYFHGTVAAADGRVDLTAASSLGIFVPIGAEIDVLFGLLFDAGATITTGAFAGMQTSIVNSQPRPPQPCFQFRMDLYAFFDPCNLCPFPTEISVEENIARVSEPQSCSFPDVANGSLAPADDGKGGTPDVLNTPVMSMAELRALQRHPALAYSETGNGLLLVLDAQKRLTATRMENGAPGPDSVVLSSAPGIRQPKVVFYADNSAMAVWVENAMATSVFIASATTDVERVRNQRLMWSRWNGSTWTAKVALTAPGTGEGNPEIAACYRDNSGCGSFGAVAVVWQRNGSGDFRNPTHGIRHAEYTPLGGWSSTQSVDNDIFDPVGEQEISPVVEYLNGNPLVVWLTYNGSASSDRDASMNTRLLRYRHVGVGAPRSFTGMPDSLGQLTLQTRSSPFVLPFNLQLAFTRADDNTGAVGTRQALHVAQGSCSEGTCSVTWDRVRDRNGRAFYGMRPKLLRDVAGNTSVVMRAFRFGATADGTSTLPGDPIGTVLSSGDLIHVHPNFTSGLSRFVPITADGAMHASHVAAFDPVANNIATASMTFVPVATPQLRAAMKQLAPATLAGFAKAIMVDDSLQFTALPNLPDLVIESITSATSVLVGGAAITVSVRIANRGSAFDPAVDGDTALYLRWDLPQSQFVATSMVLDLPAIAAGQSLTHGFSFNVPGTFRSDQAHTLFARLQMDADNSDLDGENDQAELVFGAMPVPTQLRSEIRPGSPLVQLSWTTPNDARIAGYRIYAMDVDGEIDPLGSTSVRGFLDLSARYRSPRTYFIASYSANGEESERSAGTTVTPKLAEPTETDLFKNGFE